MHLSLNSFPARQCTHGLTPLVTPHCSCFFIRLGAPASTSYPPAPHVDADVSHLEEVMRSRAEKSVDADDERDHGCSNFAHLLRVPLRRRRCDGEKEAANDVNAAATRSSDRGGEVTVPSETAVWEFETVAGAPGQPSRLERIYSGGDRRGGRGGRGNLFAELPGWHPPARGRANQLRARAHDSSAILEQEERTAPCSELRGGSHQQPNRSCRQPHAR